MRIEVRYLAQLRHAAGRDADVLEMDAPCTVGDLLVRAASANRALGRLLLDHQGQRQPALLMFLGDEQVGADRGLSDGDAVTVLSPMAGGQQS